VSQSTEPEQHGPYMHELQNGRHVALGRPRPSVLDDPRTMHRFRLARFIDRPSLPPLQDRIARPPAFTPQLFGNDHLGDCTCAAVANYTLLAAAKASRPVPQISDQDVIARYSKVAGYVPGNPATDQGAVELDVLNDWRHDPLAGVTLVAFAAIDTADTELLRYAIQLFGAAYVGLALPTSAQGQVGGLWDTAAGMQPGSWGGHAVILTDADWTLGTHELACATWGAEQRMTEAFWRACGDEAYAPLTDAFRDVPGLDYAALEAELSQLGQVS
jgi:hypothetical protein